MHSSNEAVALEQEASGQQDKTNAFYQHAIRGEQNPFEAYTSSMSFKPFKPFMPLP
jgi:hypothetical protein